jgi:hypothetical protein
MIAEVHEKEIEASARRKEGKHTPAFEAGLVAGHS